MAGKSESNGNKMNINISPVFDLPGDALYGEREHRGQAADVRSNIIKLISKYTNVELSCGGIDFHRVT